MLADVRAAGLERWRQRARRLKTDIYALYLACRDPRTPWYAKLLAFGVAAYAFSPIDLIPDPIPVLGYLDDLVLLPLGIALAIKLVPPDVMRECRERATARATSKPRGWIGGAAVVVVWLVAAGLIVLFVRRWLL